MLGLCKDIYDVLVELCKRCFEEASNCLDLNFVKLCFASSDAELSPLIPAYPALFVSWCSSLAKMLADVGITT